MQALNPPSPLAETDHGCLPVVFEAIQQIIVGLAAVIVPIAVALAGIAVGLPIIGLLTHVYPLQSFSTTLASMIGIGVGIDYALFDRLAELTSEPDRHFEELRELYRDPRLAVPATVFNAVLNRPEAA